MTAQDEIREAIKVIAIGFGADDNEDIEDADEWFDAKSEFRSYGIETDLEPPYSRHFEANQVARKMPSGNWVSWTYWYGGGKHSNPDEIDWIDDAKYVDCEEEEKVMIVRKFKDTK